MPCYIPNFRFFYSLQYRSNALCCLEHRLLRYFYLRVNLVAILENGEYKPPMGNSHHRKCYSTHCNDISHTISLLKCPKDYLLYCMAHYHLKSPCIWTVLARDLKYLKSRKTDRQGSNAIIEIL